ncbi:Ionotropic receptor 678 [Blattella germanica]|nr:Ionotropic receptor 678 [Blattella germanica]
MDLHTSIILLMVVTPIFSLVLLPTEEEFVITCLKRIAEQYFTEKSKLVISLPDLEKRPQVDRYLSISSTKSTSMDMAQLIAKELSYMSKLILIIQPNVENMNSMLNATYTLSSYQVLIVFFECTNLSKLYFEILNTKPDFIVILVLTSHYSDFENETVTRLFTIFSKAKTFNLLLLIPNTHTQSKREEIKSLALYTWYPYDPVENCGRFNKAVKVSEWVLEGEGKFTEDSKLFPQVVTANFTGCAIIAERFFENANKNPPDAIRFLLEYVEYPYLNMMADVLNMDVILSELDNFKMFNDVLIGALPLNVISPLVYESPLQPFRAAQLKWFVPCPQPILRHGNFIRVFSYEIWICIIVVTLLITFITHIFYKYINGFKLSSDFSCTFLTVWGILTGVSTDLRSGNLKIRIVLVIWVCYCLVISTIFQTLFTGFLIEPGVDGGISDIDQLNNSNFLRGIPIVEYITLLNILNKSNIFSITNVHCTFIECLNHYLKRNDFAFYAEVSFMSYFCDSLGLRCCTIDDMAVTVHYSLLIAKNSYYFDVISNTFLRVIESGIMTMIRGKAEELHKVSGSDILIGTDDSLVHRSFEDYFIFSLNHLQVTFYLFGIGCFISSVIFVCEMLNPKLKLKQFPSEIMK